MPAGCLNGSDKPVQIELPDGSTASGAALDKVQMRTVECTDGGVTMVGEAADQGTHVKVQVNAINLKEKRFDSESGFYSDVNVKMTKDKKEQFSLCTVDFGGETYDLLADGGLQFMFAKNVASLPAQALMSVRYTSSMGGQWFVDKQPVNVAIGTTSEGGGGCCVLM